MIRTIVFETAVSVLVGIDVGIAGGLGLSRYLASQLFGVKPSDFWSLAIAVACLLLAALAAMAPPALRAAKADPLAALQYE